MNRKLLPPQLHVQMLMIVGLVSVLLVGVFLVAMFIRWFEVEGFFLQAAKYGVGFIGVLWMLTLVVTLAAWIINAMRDAAAIRRQPYSDKVGGQQLLIVPDGDRHLVYEETTGGMRPLSPDAPAYANGAAESYRVPETPERAAPPPPIRNRPSGDDDTRISRR